MVETVIEFERGVSHAARGGVRGGRGKESWAMQGRQRKNLNQERVNRELKKPPRRVRPGPRERARALSVHREGMSTRKLDAM